MKIGDFCRGSYPAGLLYFNKELWTDQGVRQAADTGADFILGAESSEPLLGLCEKHKLGIISNSNITPFWWGGDGKKAGLYAEQFPPEKLEEIKNYPLSPVLWGDYFIDEPNSRDFVHINKVIKAYNKKFPGKLPYIDLYPNYGRIPSNNSEEIIEQLGNRTYAEHIEQYVREIDLPYISFDFYPFTGCFSTYLENLETVAEACKRSKKEMWVVIQAGAWKKEEILEDFQIAWQVNMCLAFGARAIIFANYSKGWWEESTSCVNNKGEKNITYDYVQNAISFLHSSYGTEFLKYEYAGAGVFGDLRSSDERIKPQLENLDRNPSFLPDMEIESDRSVITGFYKKNSGYALLITNTHNPFERSNTANVKIRAKKLKINAVYESSKTENKAKIADNNSELSIQSGQGVLVTLS